MFDTRVQVGKVWSIRHQTSHVDVLSGRVHRRQSRAQRQSDDPNTIVGYERVTADVKCLRSAFQRREGRDDVLGSPNVDWHDIQVEHAGRGVDLAFFKHAGGAPHIGEDGQATEIRNSLAQQFKFFGSKIGLLN
jgi:hypothetical protein